jgi:hypothetical protein
VAQIFDQSGGTFGGGVEHLVQRFERPLRHDMQQFKLTLVLRCQQNGTVHGVVGVLGEIGRRHDTHLRLQSQELVGRCKSRTAR